MSTPPDNPLVREWGEYRHMRRRRPVPGWLWFLLWTAAFAGIGVGVWLRVRPHTWRPPSGTPSFKSCALPGDVTGWCAGVTVPEDPRRPHGSTISLRVAVLPATRRPAVGAFFYLEGGPGVPATASAGTANELFAVVGRDHDLVLVDERGTGGSNALSCPDARVPADDTAVVSEYVWRCFARIGYEARLYTTTVAADDLEAVRRKLGYGRIDLYGVSYGATLAESYLRQYPHSVRSVVLDGASLPGVKVFETSAPNAQRTIDAVLARCAADPACARSFPHPDRDLAEVLARPPHAVTVEAGTFVLDAGDIAWTIQALSSTAEGAATIPFVVHEAVMGDYLPLGRDFVRDVGVDLDARSRLATFWEILCSESWVGLDPAATERAGGGSYLAGVALGRARLFAQACRAVPRGRVPAGGGPVTVTRAPVLLLAGGADPLDPPANLSGWRAAFPNGRLVVVPGAGHGVAEYPCVQRIVAAFVARGNTAVDTRCARHLQLPPFVIG